MDLLSRLLQAQNARNNQNIVVQRAAAALRNLNSNNNTTPFLTISSYPNMVYNGATQTQGLQHHQHVGTGIHRSTNINSNYNSNPNNNGINNSNNNGIITQSRNKNNNTNSMNNFSHINTFSQSHGAATNIVVDHPASRNNSASNHKNDNCCNDGSKGRLNFDQNKYISSLCNTNMNSINNNHNTSNSTGIAINNTNGNSNSTNNVSTQLVQMNNTRNGNQCQLQNILSTKGIMLVDNKHNNGGNVKIPYLSTQCDGIQNNNDAGMLSQITFLKQKVAAMEKQLQSGNNNVDNNNSKNSSKRIDNKTDNITVSLNNTTSGTNVNNSATQFMNTNNDISMNMGNNSNSNNSKYNNNNSDIVNSVVNGLPNDIILSQVLSSGNMNVNSNSSSILSSSNQLAHGNILSCLYENKVTELLCRLRQLELFMANNHISNNILSHLSSSGIFGSNMNNFVGSNDMNIANIQLSQLRSEIELKQRELHVLSMLKNAPNMMQNDRNNMGDNLQPMQHQEAIPSNQVMLEFVTCIMFLFFLDCAWLCGYYWDQLESGRRKNFRSDGKVFRVTENCTDNTKSACIIRYVHFCFVLWCLIRFIALFHIIYIIE